MSYLNTAALALCLFALALLPAAASHSSALGRRPLITCLNVQAPHLSPGYCRDSRVR